MKYCSIFFSTLECNLSFFLVTFMFLCDTSMLALRCWLICLFICAIVWERKGTGLCVCVFYVRVSGYVVCWLFLCVNVYLCVYAHVFILVYFDIRKYLHTYVNIAPIFECLLVMKALQVESI